MSRKLRSFTFLKLSMLKPCFLKLRSISNIASLASSYLDEKQDCVKSSRHYTTQSFTQHRVWTYVTYLRTTAADHIRVLQGKNMCPKQHIFSAVKYIASNSPNCSLFQWCTEFSVTVCVLPTKDSMLHGESVFYLHIEWSGAIEHVSDHICCRR